MRKYVLISAIYGVLGLIGGVLYRELTKAKGFTGITALGSVHPHFLGLGMLFFLVIGLLAIKFGLEKFKTYKAFMWVYNIGLILTGALLLTRGCFEVCGCTLSDGMNKCISGFSGFSHIIIAAGLVLLFIALFKVTKKEKLEETK